MQHLAGATSLLCLLLLMTPSLRAQDDMTCPPNEDGIALCPDEGGVMACPDGACKPPLGHRIRGRVANCVAGCCQKFCTDGKGCSWYRPYTEDSQPDLFYNFYVPNPRGAAAAAYPAPYPTPSLVGHTYYTYQPLMPHEFLYRHYRTYHQYYNQGMGMNRTSVHWYGTPVRTAVHGVRDIFTLPR